MSQEESIDSLPIRNIDFQKSNILITAKYNSSIDECKMLALALSNQTRMEEDGGGTIRVTIPSDEMRRALKGNKGSYYTHIKEIATAMNNRQIGIFDDRAGRFALYQLVQTCIYDNGQLHITFNSDLSKLIKNIPNSYTLLNLPIMLSFESIYSFRLYEILRSKAYNRTKADKNNQWQIEYSFYELLFDMGVVNIEDENVKKQLNFSKHPDYEKSIALAKEKKGSLTRWNNFRVKLMQAIKEINEKTDIRIEFKPIRSGKGGKVSSIIFLVTKEVENDQDTIKNIAASANLDNLAMEDEFIDYISENIPISLKTSERRILAKASGYNKEKIQKAYRIYLASSSVIENDVGFLLTAINEDWSEVKKEKSKRVIKTQFSNFNQRVYDYKELEKEALASFSA